MKIDDYKDHLMVLDDRGLVKPLCSIWSARFYTDVNEEVTCKFCLKEINKLRGQAND